MNPNGIFKIGPEYFHAEKICSICALNNNTVQVFTDGGTSDVRTSNAAAHLHQAVRDWKAALKRCQPKLVLGRIRTAPARLSASPTKRK
jgi:hypothetical protein